LVCGGLQGGGYGRKDEKITLFERRNNTNYYQVYMQKQALERMGKL